MSERASGWYDDPQDPDQLRYWDGILWSDRTMPKVKPGLENSRIGDAKRQYEEEQERLRAAEQASARSRYPEQPQMRPYQRGEHDPYGQPGNQGYGQTPYGPRQPYQPRPVKVTPDGEPTASWWRRLFAYVIDNILLSAVAVAVSWTWLHPWATTFINWYDDLLDAAEAGRSQPPIPEALYQVPWQFPLIAAVLYLVYEIAMIAWRGQTVGHLICGIRVRSSESTAKPGLNAVAIRAVVKGVNTITSLVPFLGSLGLVFGLVDGLVPLGDRHAQSLHDKAAKTYVVRSRAPKPPYGAPAPPHAR
ncbi:RDD family protein [Flexivirga oryzae]|uniref:Putative RDD family membrane protein YckC n=1 Tax=Flexivirga oryzae TaxID=1794944 RepID=A0A839N425_9MICO|nr:RDD family protein [Flexivirga oryzae]MBB2890814.1 putative RDD family membrane protein YckC [Flexivirga oryzae]